MKIDHLIRRRINIIKTDEMIRQSFFFFLLFNLAIVSPTSTSYSRQRNGQLSFIGNNDPSETYYEQVETSGNRPSVTEEDNNNRMRGVGYYYYQRPSALIATTSSPTTLRPATTSTANSRPVRWDPYVSDTCGGTVNIPLSFNRLLPYKSTHFPSRRDYPIICSWNFTVMHGNCRRALVTMRLDGRSRLPDVDGCRKGYYRVSPYMKGARICGRIGNVPAFQWYVDAHQPVSDVTVVTMKNMGINDGYYEGLSFTLQGECVHDELYDPRRISVDKENARLNRRWMNRVFEDFVVGEGPRIIVKPTPRPKIPVTTSRPTTTRSYASTRTTTPVVSYEDGGIPWLILKLPNQKSANENQFRIKNGTTTGHETIPLQLEYPTTTTATTTTTTYIPSPTGLETIDSTDQFPTTTSTLFVMETTSNEVQLSTDPSTTMTTPFAQVITRTTFKESVFLSDVASTTTTTERPTVATTFSSVEYDPPDNISGPKFVFSLLQQALQRTFFKFLKLFS